MVLVVRKDFPPTTLSEFTTYVRANAAKVQFGSAGAGTTTHLGCAQINAAIGVNVTHVPYRGGGPALNDVIGGQIDYYCANIGGPVQVIKAGQVKALATLSRIRSPILPDLPTAHEQGLTDFDVVTWNAFFLPEGAPAEIVKRLSDATSEAMDSPSVATRLREMGVTAVARDRRSPQYLARFVSDEIARWAGPIKQNGLQVD
jgi:tripartite-type tricarboxylate transporter receptor subunit TctC